MIFYQNCLNRSRQQGGAVFLVHREFSLTPFILICIGVTSIYIIVIASKLIRYHLTYIVHALAFSLLKIVLSSSYILHNIRASPWLGGSLLSTNQVSLNLGLEYLINL